MSSPTYTHKKMNSPIGELTLIAGEKGLAAVLWECDKPSRVHAQSSAEEKENIFLKETEKQLQEYFAGKRKVFDLTLDFFGTDFQKSVWAELLKIPYGETRSYGEIAKSLGKPLASRAVGAANGKNPISIIAPCHRVIGSSGKLTGFAGGLESKAFLLDLERAQGRLPGTDLF